MRRRFVPVILALTLLAAAGDAPPSDVVAQRGDTRLTAADVRDLLSRADPAVRTQAESNPAALAIFVRDRLLEKAMLDEARAKGWDQKPDVIQRANDARDAVIRQAYVASLAPPDPSFPSDADVAAAYEANKARFMLPQQDHLAQIVVLVPANAAKDVEDEARRKVADLRAQALRPHADFADLAKKQSQDKITADRGGDLGWLREDALLPAVKDAVSGLTENGTSDPVRATDGWHILRLLGTKPAGPAALADVKPQLVAALRQARTQQTLRAYIDDMQRKEPIQINEIDLTRQVSGQH